MPILISFARAMFRFVKFRRGALLPLLFSLSSMPPTSALSETMLRRLVHLQPFPE